MSNRIQVDFQEDSSAVIMARIAERATAPPPAVGTPFVQANFVSISLSVYERTEDAEAVVAGFDALALTVASVIFDTLQGWAIDTVGHNFRYTVPAAAFPRGHATYRVEVKWTHTDGRVGHTVFVGPAAPLSRS